MIRRPIKNSTMRRMLSIILLAYLLVMTFMPFSSYAAGQGAPPERPYEKAIVQKGSWYTSQFTYEGANTLVVGFRGNFNKPSTEAFFTFDVKETTVLTGIYIPFPGLLLEPMYMALVSDQGNVYQGFSGEIAYVGTLKEVQPPSSPPPPGYDDTGGMPDGEPDEEQDELIGDPENTEGIEDYTPHYGERLEGQKGDTIVYYYPEDAIVLPKGRYMIQLAGGAWPAEGYFVKGMDFKAYEKYKEKLVKWLGEEEPEVIGNQELSDEFWDRVLSDLVEEPTWMGVEIPYKAPAFELDESYIIDEIILSTWNNGEGAMPGIIYIYNDEDEMVAAFQSQGYGPGNAPNTFWMVMPDIILPPGVYYLDIDDKWALDFDEDGDPVFSVSVSPAPEEFTVFTGTYNMNIFLYKIRTLMGDVDPPEKSKELYDQVLAVIDKGEFIEIIGKYEGMPFSQNCPVLERGVDYAVAKLEFAADLTGLPYKAAISANGEIRFEKAINGVISVTVGGNGYYERLPSKDKGADNNTYNLNGKGYKVKDELPSYVIAAIGAAYGAGNIPGPDSPFEAAAGMLFPPLVGLLATAISNALKPKEMPKPKPSGRLISERESEAWAILAEALGASGGDPNDPVSVGDNEIAAATGGASGGESGGVFGGYDEDGGYDGGTSTDSYEGGYEAGHEAGTTEGGYETGAPDSGVAAPAAAGPDAGQTPGTPGTGMPEGPDELELVTDHTGRTSRYVRDPATGEYVNPETGGVLDMEVYEKVVKPNLEKDREFIDREWEKNVKGETLQDYLVWETEMKIDQQRKKDELYRQLFKKYNVSSRADLEAIIGINDAFNKQSYERWMHVDRVGAWAEGGATLVMNAADASMDALGKVTGPVGKGINAGYKFVRNVAYEGASGDWSVKSLKKGAVKGAAAAARGYVPGAAGKFATVVTGETVAGYIDKGAEGAAQGFVEGSIKGAMLHVSDKLAKPAPGTTLPKFPLTEGDGAGFIKSAAGPITKVFGAKLGKNVTDSFVVKPYVSKPLGKATAAGVRKLI